ncbi:MAG TPA: metal-dependent hydrolase [Chondromyces sp.]|nr:metal-dependent hydrolase [Chondromyces sp.]
MDTITHTLFGAGLYGVADKRQMDKKTKLALLSSAIAASQIPDIDVISQLWDTNGMYQMWHRGITHSLFLVPVWAAFISFLTFAIWRIPFFRFFKLNLLAVFIHDTSDAFNAWGTGYLEPFSNIRLTFGTIPIIDFVIWLCFLSGFLIVKLKKVNSHKVFRIVWVVIIVHIGIQTTQGFLLKNHLDSQFDQTTLSAGFIPGTYTIAGKSGETVELWEGNLWSGLTKEATFHSEENASLERLFNEKPEAKTLVQWSPFVVIVDDEEKLGLFDPRFYRQGNFLYVYIEK